MVPYYIGGMVFGFLFAVIMEWAAKRVRYPGHLMRVTNTTFIALTFALMVSLFVTALAIHISVAFGVH